MKHIVKNNVCERDMYQVGSRKCDIYPLAAFYHTGASSHSCSRMCPLVIALNQTDASCHFSLIGDHTFACFTSFFLINVPEVTIHYPHRSSS